MRHFKKLKEFGLLNEFPPQYSLFSESVRKNEILYIIQRLNVNLKILTLHFSKISASAR